MLERSGRPKEKRTRLRECMKYKITIFLYTRRFIGIQVRERFVFEEFMEAMHEPQRGSPKFSTDERRLYCNKDK